MQSKFQNNNNLGFKRHSEDERKKLMEDSIPQNTKNATKTWMKVLNNYVKQVNGNLDITVEDICTEELPQLLYEFYCDVKYKNYNEQNPDECEKYKNTSMKSIHGVTNRYMKNSREIDIMKDVHFTKSNEMFKAVTKENKKQGKDNIEHKAIICAEDMKAIDKYFQGYMKPNAEILQEVCLFNVLYYGCHRGRENLAAMTKDTFEVHFIPIFT